MDDTDSESGTLSSGVDDATGLPQGDVLLDLGTQIDICQAIPGQDEFAPCKVAGPPDAFEPELQWDWAGEGDLTDVYVMPLVANLTDDTGDGVVDLCDKPDVVVLAAPLVDNLTIAGNVARLFVLDGHDGTVHADMGALLPGYTPALADLDGDGTIEIVAVVDAPGGTTTRGRIVVFHADGTKVVEGASAFDRDAVGAIALADIDGDGTGEIIVDHVVLDATGTQRLSITSTRQPQLPVAADLEDDGRLEVVWGHVALRAGGEHVYDNDLVGYPHVANFDDDPAPEILVTYASGLALLEADGGIAIEAQTPEFEGEQRVTGDNAWRRPAAIHDIYGADGISEIVMSAGDYFMAIDYATTRGFKVAWQRTVSDNSEAAATAFDFLGDGRAEALYADHVKLMMFDFDGREVIEKPHASITRQELPIVADVDNDGSAEIVVVSNHASASNPSPAVQVWGDELDRWVPARRIWNQHTYHVTNIEEDGSLPGREVPAYRRLNTFRTNVQIEAGVICKPEP